MANDLTAMQAVVLGDLPRFDMTNAMVTTEVVSSVLEYEGQRFFFNEQAIGGVTLSATNTYAFSLWTPGTTPSTASDVIELDSVRVNLTSRSYTLEQISYAKLNDLDEASTSTPGYPEVFAIWNRGIRIYPTPAATLTMTATLSAHVKFPELSAGADANVWTLEAKDLIRNAAVKRIWIRRLTAVEGAAGAIAMAERLEQAALANLQRRTSGLAGNRIRPFL